MGFSPGTTVAERYRLEQVIGSGGMGAVWAARHRITGKAVALKVLAPGHAHNPEARTRFVREAKAASLVKHPNVVAIHDIVEHDGTLALVMDLLEGENLGQRLDRVGRLPIDELARILVPVISAVGTANARGVVHRDLKPENIFLLADPPDDVRVLDFGIAKLTEQAAQDGGLTNTGALLGTPYYMSPEQVFGEKDVDARADVWALGVIVYECLAGARPLEGDNAGQIMKAILVGEIEPLAEVAPDAPPEVCSLVDRMLRRDRAERLSDLREAFDVLGRFTEVTSQRFAPPASQPPHISVSPSLASDSSVPSDPYAATVTPASSTWDDAPAGAARRRADTPLLDTAGPFEMPARGSGSSKLLGAALLALLAGAGAGAVWLWWRPTAPAPAATMTPSASASAVETRPSSAPSEHQEAAASAPAKSAAAPLPSAAAAASASNRPRSPSSPLRAVKPRAPAASSLPHGVYGEVPF